jgi:LEA14-like dessication related protein
MAAALRGTLLPLCGGGVPLALGHGVMRRTLLHASLLTVLCIALSVVTVLLTGCGTLARGLHIVNPRYTIRDVRPRIDVAIPLAASSIDFDFMLGVDNPNSVGLRLDRLDFDIFINDNPIADGFTSERVAIPAHGFSEVPFRVRVGYGNIRNIWREITDMVKGDRARYEVRGRAWYDTPIGQLQFPVHIVRGGERR